MPFVPSSVLAPSSDARGQIDFFTSFFRTYAGLAAGGNGPDCGGDRYGRQLDGRAGDTKDRCGRSLTCWALSH